MSEMSSIHEHVRFAVLDEVRSADLATRLAAESFRRCSLSAGDEVDRVNDIAAQLIEIECEPSLVTFPEGLGRAWGIYIHSPATYDSIQKHLESLLTIQTEDGDILHFRYYDPRVLRVFLPTCTPDQIREFFGPITAFYVEAEGPRYCLVFTHENGALRTETIDLQAPAAATAAAG